MIVILSVIHVLPNLSAWSFSVANNSQQSMVTSLVPTTAIDPSIPSTNPSNNIVASTALVFPIPSKGTVYYVQPRTMFTSTTNCSIHEASTNFPQRHYLHTSKFAYFATTFCTRHHNASPCTTFYFAKKEHLPEWSLAQFNGDTFQWHEWFSDFESAIDSYPLTDDAKLTYLMTLATGKTKTTIAKIAYCATMYKDPVKTLEQMFGQPKSVVSAYLDKLRIFYK